MLSVCSGAFVLAEAGILDGDTVLIRKGEVADNGQIVVALVDDSYTVKRLVREAGVPSGIVDAVLDAYHRLGPSVPVAAIHSP